MKRILIYLLLLITDVYTMEKLTNNMTCRQKISLLDAFRCDKLYATHEGMRFTDYECDLIMYERSISEVHTYFGQILENTPDPARGAYNNDIFKSKPYVKKILANRRSELTQEDILELLCHAFAWELKGVKGDQAAIDLKPALFNSLQEKNVNLINVFLKALVFARGPELAKPILWILQHQKLEKK